MTDYQHFWRCAHYPSAMTNFFLNLKKCEWSCNEQPLRWHHLGSHPLPKSWAIRVKA